MENEDSKKGVGKSAVVFNKKILFPVLAVILLAIIIFAFVLIGSSSRKSEPSIVSSSTLEKIINVSDLSTFEAIYNGVAKVMNEDNNQDVDYYVSYNAKVKAGIDFEQVDISVDDEEKVISVKLPEIKITDITVDIESLDYIFINASANTSTVSEKAYKKCIEDVTTESKREEAIYDLAKQNAHNIVQALISPFVNSLDTEYKLEID